METIYLTNIFFLSTLSFVAAMAATPVWSGILYKYHLGKRLRTTGVGGGAPIFRKLHAAKAGTPTMGGILIWVPVAALTLLLNFDRGETWLPLFTIVSVGAIGALDDYLNIRGIGPSGGGIRFRHKLVAQLAIGGVGAWWFYDKLDYVSLHVPAVGDFTIGWLYIPVFIIVMVATTTAVNESDGLDGLAGGLLAIAFTAFGALSYVNELYLLAAFCGSVVGALLAFLWFNIHPARFFMGDTGSMALGATLAVVAALNDAMLILPIVGFVFVVEAVSVIVQLLSKKFLGRKIFHSTPIHHHFEAIGWPETKVTMRFWIIGAVFAVIGLVAGVVGGGS
ncbi:MAG: phospho-N-acetylmuramoyl-pentapeptide-transferase [bacterium]|nr:phospho-N-acetylmuramoyl-pentapeptide-transferase [bacterium]MDZ4247775.1 phospho-N-acetylmuramoyl-pentapeptide-transferase [Patescibacteria group bacterium]